MWMKPPSARASPGSAVKFGSALNARLIFATVPAASIAADACEKSGLELHRIDQSEQRSPRIGVRHHRLRLQLFARRQRDAGSRAHPSRGCGALRRSSGCRRRPREPLTRVQKSAIRARLARAAAGHRPRPSASTALQHCRPIAVRAPSRKYLPPRWRRAAVPTRTIPTRNRPRTSAPISAGDTHPFCRAPGIDGPSSPSTTDLHSKAARCRAACSP